MPWYCSFTRRVVWLNWLDGSNPSIQLSWTTRRRNPNGAKTPKWELTLPGSKNGTEQRLLANRVKNGALPCSKPTLPARAAGLSLTGLMSAKRAGITESDQNKQKSTPMAVKIPKATGFKRGQRKGSKSNCGGQRSIHHGANHFRHCLFYEISVVIFRLQAQQGKVAAVTWISSVTAMAVATDGITAMVR